MRVETAGPSHAAVEGTLAAFRSHYPPLYRDESGEATVPITFWTMGSYGPHSRLRMIDASPWSEIERNYTAAVRDGLVKLMDDTFEPGKDGQLLLWQGPPGTGKTWALRALASEWRPWAEFHYITDPDAFFVTDPIYMIDVLLADSYDELTPRGEVVATDRQEKWRVLILEDTGELLAANAKDAYGQGLSRLLNVVDGMVGQGLRVLALVTTNDELGDLHPAVMRPGRCASRIEFGPLTADEATAWLGAPSDGGTLAELYARSGTSSEPLPASEPEPDSQEGAGPEEAYEAEDEALAALADEARIPLMPLIADARTLLTRDQEPDSLLASAFDALAESNRGHAEAVKALALSALGSRDAERRTLTAAAAAALEKLAGRPAPRPPDVHVSPAEVVVHSPDVNVTLPEMNVTVPEQKFAPVVNVPAQRPPDVRVEVVVPDQPAPTVDVHVPQQPAPVVTVDAPVEVHVEHPKPVPVRVEIGPDGERRFVPEPAA